MTVIFCIPGNSFSSRFLLNWTNLIHSLKSRGIEYILKTGVSSIVHEARSKCLEGHKILGKNQIPFQGKLKYDYIMWIDSDIDFSPEQFYTLLDMNKPIASGMYKIQNDQVNNSQYAVKPLDSWKENLLSDIFLQQNQLINTQIPVDFAGMGWMLVAKGVIESMQYPWFRSECESKNVDGIPYPVVELVGEDVYFCRVANSMGFGVWVNTGCIVGHEKTVVLK
jgi:hypothetical protein